MGYMPILYEADETAFDTLGLGYCNCISCTVQEVRNCLEDYKCTMVYPVSGPLANEFTDGRLLLVLQDDSDEALADRETFAIYDRAYDMNAGTMTVYAMQEAVFLAKYIVLGKIKAATTTAAARAAAFRSNVGWYQTGYNNVTVSVDSSITGNYNFPEQQPRSLLESIQGSEGSLLQICGGDLKCHRRTITLCKDRGSDNGAIVRYGKNLKQFTYDANSLESYNAIMPYWVYTDSETGSTTTVTGADATYGQIARSKTQETAHWHTMVYDVSSELKAPDDWEATDDEPYWMPTSAEVFAAGAAHIDELAPGTIPVVYYAEIEQDPDDPPIEMCDTVLVQHPDIGVNTKMQISSRTFNPLTRRHKSLGIGSVTKSLTRAIKDLVKKK